MKFDSFATWFFKSRSVLCAGADGYNMVKLTQNKFLAERWPSGQSLPGSLQDDLSHYIDRKTVEDRSEECSLFTVTHRKSGDLAGFYWAVIARNNSVWHDKFRVDPGSALLFNAYVIPRFRRLGVYSLLIGCAHNYLLGEVKCKQVFTIVEDQNVASMRANAKFGLQVCMRNYLIKFARKTVFSIFLKKNDIEIHFVIRNAKGHSF